MGLKEIFGFGGSQAQREANIKKRMLLQFCDLDELVEVWKKYVKREEPKFQYTDDNGLIKYRIPTRKELVDALVSQVPLEGIIKTLPHLKDKLDSIEEGSQ